MLLSQDRILTNTKILMENEKPKSMQTDEFDRIVWLSRFCQEPIDKQKQPKTRASQLIRWSIVLGVIYLMSSIVIDAYNYHPRYLEILEKEKHEIAQAIKDQQEKDQQEKERKEQ